MIVSHIYGNLAERLRRIPAKDMGIAHVGSNPTIIVWSDILMVEK